VVTFDCSGRSALVGNHNKIISRRDFSFSRHCARDPLAEAPDKHRKKDRIHWGIFLSLCAPDIKYKRRAFLLYSLARPAEREREREQKVGLNKFVYTLAQAAKKNAE
jgi:hypothetical protein